MISQIRVGKRHGGSLAQMTLGEVKTYKDNKNNKKKQQKKKHRTYYLRCFFADMMDPAAAELFGLHGAEYSYSK